MYCWFSFVKLNKKNISKLSKLNFKNLGEFKETSDLNYFLIYPSPEQWLFSIKDDLINNNYKSSFSFLDDKFIELNKIYKDTIIFKNEKRPIVFSLWQFESLSLKCLEKYFSNSDETEIKIESCNSKKPKFSFELSEILKLYMIKKFPEIIKNYYELELSSNLFGREPDKEFFEITDNYLISKYFKIFKKLSYFEKIKNSETKKLEKLNDKILEKDENLDDLKKENIYLKNMINELKEKDKINQISICELQEEIERQYHNLILRDKLIINQSEQIKRSIKTLSTN